MTTEILDRQLQGITLHPSHLVLDLVTRIPWPAMPVTSAFSMNGLRCRSLPPTATNQTIL